MPQGQLIRPTRCPNGLGATAPRKDQRLEPQRDVLVVARLDRLGRSLMELIDLVAELEGRGVGFRSLKESLDTTTAGGA